MTKILAFAGSLRRDSFNKKLVRAAATKLREAGVETTTIDLRDYPLPIYDGDLEEREGIPQNALRLKALFGDHGGLLISSPEYNSSISGVLKNTIDWVSRPTEGEAPLAAFRGKAAALLSASPGGGGGLRGLVTVRSILGNIGVLVLPTQLAVPAAHKAFADNGSMLDEGLDDRLSSLMAELADITKRLSVHI